MSSPLGIGLLGIGGYAQEHLNVLTTLHEFGLCRLVAVADPFVPQRAEAVNALRASGVTVFEDPARLLERDDVEAVIIATPVHLHTPQALAALASGKHVYLEKPPCATIGQWRQLVAARGNEQVFAIGFQMQSSPALRFLKQRLIEGAIGTLQQVWAGVRWQRNDGYYNRSAWAARWFVDGLPTFDGPATNALAHVVHGSLFLAGAGASEFATLARVRGSLKRARPIESFDTSYIDAETTGGVHVQLAFTHATARTDEVTIRCAGSAGTGSIGWDGTVTIATDGEAPVRYHFSQRPTSAATLDFLRAIATGSPPLTPIAAALPFLQATNGALQSSRGAHSFATANIEAVYAGTPQQVFTVRELDPQIERFQVDYSQPPALLADDATNWVPVGEIGEELAVGG